MQMERSERCCIGVRDVPPLETRALHIGWRPQKAMQVNPNPVLFGSKQHGTTTTKMGSRTMA